MITTMILVVICILHLVHVSGYFVAAQLQIVEPQRYSTCSDVMCVWCSLLNSKYNNM